MKITAFISLLLLSCGISHADTILRIYAGASHWQHDLVYHSDSKLDLDR